MSNGRFCLIRDLGLVKGGKGLKHHEVVLELSWRGLFRCAASRIRIGSRTHGPASQEPEAQMETTWSST
jgi:hypothetical protein